MSDNTAPTTTDYQPKERMTDLLTRFDTAMMVSECGKTGQYHARPMVVARVDEGLNLWFFTEFCAPKVEEMKTNNKLCATFQDKDMWLSLAGTSLLCSNSARPQSITHVTILQARVASRTTTRSSRSCGVPTATSSRSGSPKTRSSMISPCSSSRPSGASTGTRPAS